MARQIYISSFYPKFGFQICQLCGLLRFSCSFLTHQKFGPICEGPQGFPNWPKQTTFLMVKSLNENCLLKYLEWPGKVRYCRGEPITELQPVTLQFEVAASPCFSFLRIRCWQTNLFNKLKSAANCNAFNSIQCNGLASCMKLFMVFKTFNNCFAWSIHFLRKREFADVCL